MSGIFKGKRKDAKDLKGLTIAQHRANQELIEAGGDPNKQGRRRGIGRSLTAAQLAVVKSGIDPRNSILGNKRSSRTSVLGV